MKIHADILRQYIELPRDLHALRALLDDCGLEVKRLESDGHMTLELLANRGDHHAYEGLARELCGRLGNPVRLPEIAELQVGESPWPLRLETDRCLVYTATLLTGGTGRLPPEVLAPLTAAGIHSLTAPIDATNLVNLELGQPTHAFDADTLDGPITIRLSRPGEQAWPLFAAERVTVPTGTLVIADDSKILAIAGVIGCEESKTTANTRRLLLESATFDPVSVRIAGRALGIHTDSSARFERGADPARPLVGAGRVVHLLERYAGWRRSGPSGRVGAWTDPARLIGLNVATAAHFLNADLGVEEAAERLRRYGFAVSAEAGALQVRVPPHRLWDVESVADLYEELAKSIGYNATPATLPPVDMGAQPLPREEHKRRAEEILLGQGFYELFTDGFYAREMREKLGLSPAHPLWPHVEIQNALDRGYALLKNNGLAQAMATVATNLRFRNEQVRAYEWTRTFHPRPGDSSRAFAPCTERPILWAVALGTPPSWDNRSRPSDAMLLKGVVEELAVELGIPLTLGPAEPTHPLAGCLHPGRQAVVRLGDRTVGILGEVHPNVVRGFGVKRGAPVYLEIEADALLGTAGHRPDYVEPSNLHPVVRSLAFGLPPGVEAGAVAATLAEAGPSWLREVAITDLFLPGEGLRAVTFELRYANTDGAGRSAEEVNAATEAMVRAVTGAFPTVKQR